MHAQPDNIACLLISVALVCAVAAVWLAKPFEKD